MHTLKSNEYWGRRSGKVRSDGNLAFQQQQWGVGRENKLGKKKRKATKSYHDKNRGKV